MPICDHKSVAQDFGAGLYATESEELAGQWASAGPGGGFINVFDIDTEGLSIIDLCSEDYSILNWVAIILSNRIIRSDAPGPEKTAGKILSVHMPDISGADIVMGYRADGINLALCRAFIEGKLTTEALEELIIKCDLGDQVLLRSDRAVSRLVFKDAIPTDGAVYHLQRQSAESKAAALSSRYIGNELSNSMRCLGELLSCSCNAIDGPDPERFLDMFMISGYSRRYETGDPSVIYGLSGTELYHKVIADCDYPSGKAPDTGERIRHDGAYGCGELLAYYMQESGRPLKDIFRYLSFGRLYGFYPELSRSTLKEASSAIERKIHERSTSSTRLQTVRKRSGMSQKALSEASGVNIRTLQQYEIGNKDINHAAACKVLSLSRTLYCDPKDIMEYRPD